MALATGGGARPVWTHAAAPGSAREPRSTGLGVAGLVAQAQAALQLREAEAAQDLVAQAERRGHVEVLLSSAIEVLEDANTEKNREQLQRAIEAAQEAQALPELRVRARKLLDRCRRTDQEAGRVGETLRRLARQLEACDAAAGGDATAGGDAAESQRKKREQALLRQLRQALEEAMRKGADEGAIEAARDLARRVERRRAETEKAEARLRRLKAVREPQELAELLEGERGRCAHLGRGPRRLLEELEHQARAALSEDRHRQWLARELGLATERGDATRLQQLVQQARLLGLAVPPEVLALMHGLEAQAARAAQPSPAADPTPRAGPRGGERVRERLRAAAAERLAEAEEEPTAEDVRDARQAVAVAKQRRVAEEDLAAMERRLAAVEAQHVPRLEIEERLREMVRLAAQARAEPGAQVLGEPVLLEELRGLVQRGAAANADSEVLDEATALLHRSLDAQASRQEAHGTLERLLSRPARTEADADRLQEAVQQARRCGVSTCLAEKELRRYHSEREQIQAVEAEVLQAIRGEGPKGRRRLEDAVHAAKAVGVPPDRLQAGIARLQELDDHERRCATLSGSIRRALPVLPKEPWRLPGLLDAARSLQPWPPDLQRLVYQANESVRQTMASQQQRRDLERDLGEVLRRVRAARAGGHACAADDACALLQLAERAKALGDVDAELLQEASKQASALQRERCQREVAEHRLRLALKARDVGEVERSMREVRALSHVVDGGGRGEAPHSARLMEAAATMLRQMSDGHARRQAVIAALQDRLSDPPAPPSLPSAALAGGAPAAGGSGEERLRQWAKDISGMLQEARQCGVPATFIEHAKQKLQERRREHRERQQACEALQQSLSKKDVAAHEVLRNLRKVQRYAAPALA